MTVTRLTSGVAGVCPLVSTTHLFMPLSHPQVLKSATQREDGGRAIFGGLDMAEWLLIEGGLLPKLLGMLAALQPAATLRASRRRRAAATAATTSSNRQCQQPPQSPLQPDSDRPVVELPYELKALAAGFPGAVATAAAASGGDAPLPPYMGYRGDLVSMLSNGAYRRPRVASALLASGGLELLLAQTHLDDHSPLAREWALWGVRNLCESCEEVGGLSYSCREGREDGLEWAVRGIKWNMTEI